MAILSGTALSKSNPSAKPHRFSLDTATGKGSCSCPGWTKRVAADGSRDCTHLKGLRAGGVEAHPVKRRVGEPTPSRTLATEPTDSTRIAPMLASAMPAGKSLKDFAGPEWMLEEKIDGHRVLFHKAGKNIHAWSRPRASGVAAVRILPPHILKAASVLPDGTFDGELIFPGGTSSDVPRLDKQKDLVLVLFDMLAVYGTSVTGRTYTERAAMLDLAVAHMGDERIIILPFRAPVSQTAVDAIWAAGGEGAILKRITSTYRPGYRSADWIKVKKSASILTTVTGFTAGKSGPYSSLDLLTDDGIATRVKTLNNEELRMITANPESFIGRRLVVSYQERTKDSLRHPMFDHWV